MRKKFLSVTLGILLIVFLVGEVLTFSKPEHDLDPSKDLFNHVNADQKVTELIKGACYDCHSYETDYVWYTYIFPISVWTEDHVEHARHHVNFSVWADYKIEDWGPIADECAEEIEEGEMPLKSYTLLHKEADLNNEERQKLIEFFAGITSSEYKGVGEDD